MVFVSSKNIHDLCSCWVVLTVKIDKLIPGESERDHVVSLARVRVETSHWFGTASSVRAGPLYALIAVRPAGPTVAAEGHGVGEDGVGVHGAAGQYGRTVFHLVIGTASLDQEACAEWVLQVTVLLNIQYTNTSSTHYTFQILENKQLFVDFYLKIG